MEVVYQLMMIKLCKFLSATIFVSILQTSHNHSLSLFMIFIRTIIYKNRDVYYVTYAISYFNKFKQKCLDHFTNPKTRNMQQNDVRQSLTSRLGTESHEQYQRK
ncbi:Hypothetical_protein [Hexamita inflata]|uniref:Hypothetical_protein n=1 Tax=Hexamita inflata TaxID=28002 RepID=A0AA86NPU1_9EUKA|nr:Hypothetical protein HINF_LOCUS11034 [Hexamita inflata]